jgi:hypothetical protein
MFGGVSSIGELPVRERGAANYITFEGISGDLTKNARSSP